MAEPVIVPQANDQYFEQGEFGMVPTQLFYTWIDAVTELVNNSVPLVGSGSPEGVVTASVGRWYVDQDTVGTGIYLKETGDGNTGWVKRS